MKSPRRYIIGVVLIIIVGSGYWLYKGIKGFAEIDWCSDHGHGLTTLHGRVIDTLTGKPIDSVELRIVYAWDWSHYLDTVIKQNDTLQFTFNAGDCDPYFYTIYSKYYWIDHANHPRNVGIDKGVVNNFEFYLKPATFFKISASRDTLDRSDDRVYLEIKKANTSSWEELADISWQDFRQEPVNYMSPLYSYKDSSNIRTVTRYDNFESTITYDVRCIRSNSQKIDTILYQVLAKPFDTLSFHHNFQH